MPETLSLKTNAPLQMAQIGRSLSSTLYEPFCDVLLTGPLGAGKTTLLQGFLAGLGVTDAVTSPTYALEQRYTTSSGTEILHIDLYRLSEKDADALLSQTEDFEGIRCIEWADRRTQDSTRPCIVIDCSEEGDGRNIAISFNDAAVPSSEQIGRWRDGVLLQHHIRSHCECVAHVALTLADALIAKGIAVRKELLGAACRLHDLLRFIDFKAGGGPDGIQDTEEEQSRWQSLKERFNGMHHEEACAAFLRAEGYPAVARIIETHGVSFPPGSTATVEQQLLYYADKRCIVADIVSIDERFADFERRFGSHRKAESLVWMAKAKEIEARLFPEGVPPLS